MNYTKGKPINEIEFDETIERGLPYFTASQLIRPTFAGYNVWMREVAHFQAIPVTEIEHIKGEAFKDSRELVEWIHNEKPFLYNKDLYKKGGRYYYNVSVNSPHSYHKAIPKPEQENFMLITMAQDLLYLVLGIFATRIALLNSTSPTHRVNHERYPKHEGFNNRFYLQMLQLRYYV